MRSQSNFEKKSQLSSSQLDIDNSVKNTQKSIKKYPSQQELFYYVEKQIGNNKDITLKGARQSFSQSGVELSTQQSRQKRQKIIYLQRDMIQYAPENMLLKQTSQLLKNKLKKPSNLYEMKDFDQEQFQHFKRDVHMPFANIFPNSNQKLSKLLGYEPTNQSLIGMNEFRLAMEKRSIKALVNKQQAGNTTNGSRLQPVLLKDPMKNFDTFFTTKLEYHKKEQILSPQKKKQYKEDDVPLRRSDIFQQEIVQSKHKIYRNIIIVHINPFRQNAVELLEYRIPFYSNTEQVLKDNFSSNQRLMDNLFENATKYFQLPYQLKFVSLLDETPINQLQDIPLDQNIIIISNNPKDNFWLKFYDSKQMAKPNEKEFQSLLNKLNNINDVHQIDLFFKNKKSFLTGIDDFSAHTSCILNSNNLSKFNSTQNLQQVKNPKEIITELQPCNNDLRTSKYENQFRQTLSQSTNNPTPNKLNSQIFQANISISSPNNYQITRGSFLSPYSKKQSQLSYSRLESFATPQKSHSGMFSTKGTLPQINDEDNKYLKKGNSRMRVIEEPKKLRENIIQTQQTQNQNEMKKQKLTAIVQQNIDKYTSLDEEMKKKYNLLNDAANVSTILSKTSFDRYQLHLLFSKFKALIDYKAKYRNPLKKSPKIIIEEGVDVISFRRGVDSLLVAPTEQIEKIFQSQNAFVTKDQGGMNWEGFIYSLNMIEAKTDNAKIDLFMRLLDENQNGTISYDEIFDQSNQLLRQLLKNENKEGVSVDDISHFLTKTIFDAVGQDYDKEILSEDLKLQIRRKNKDLELLLMLCFYNNEQPHNYYSNSDEEDIMDEEKREKNLYK